MNRLITSTIAALSLAVVLVPTTAQAAETVDCTETESYYLAVIGNYQDALAGVTAERDYWREAEEHVAAAAVQRNIEYAAEVQDNDRLRFKVASLRQVIRALREAR